MKNSRKKNTAFFFLMAVCFQFKKCVGKPEMDKKKSLKEQKDKMISQYLILDTCQKNKQ